MTAYERLQNIIDALGDSIVNATDEEILEDCRLEGRDPQVEAERIKGIMRKAVADWMAKNPGESL